MYKLLLCVLVLSIIILNKELKPVVTNNTIPHEKFYSHPIALVKYHDVIYHCEGVVKTTCGHSLHCGELSVHCANDLVIEYL